MKAVVICPFDRPNVPSLAEGTPLAAISIFGKPLIVYWLEYLAKAGAKNVLVLAADRPDQIRTLTGNGARWGLRVDVIPEARELTPEEAREKYGATGSDWLAERNGVILSDSLPGAEVKLFESYAGFISALSAWMPQAAQSPRIGLREIEPGIWVGLHSRISPGAQLKAPCWIGDNVSIASDAVVGPMAVVENQIMVESAAEITDSYVGPETLVGPLTQVKGSLALGNILVNWHSGSSVRVPDAFLMCSLKDRRPHWEKSHWLGRAAAALLLLVSAPVIGAAILKGHLQGQRVLRPRRAVLPQLGGGTSSSVVYYEFSSAATLWRRWPQLWNILRGDFTWVGNRPINPFEAAKLVNDFERLWLAAPIGFISQADAEGCLERFSDEARAHAAFYAAQANWRLDFSILHRGLSRLMTPRPDKAGMVDDPVLKEKSFRFGRTMAR